MKSPTWRIIEVPVNEPRISVIIPCHNLAEYVGKAIESAMDQCGGVAADVVVVDDGSTDNSAEIIRRYSDHVKIVSLQPNRGVSVARNSGAEHAAGNWYLFLDADDFLSEGALKEFGCVARTSGGGVVFGQVTQYDIERDNYSERSNRDLVGQPPSPAKKGFWRSALPTPGAAIVHESVHRAIGGFEKPWQPTEDRDYWLKCGVTTAFRYCDYPVLTKLRRRESVRLQGHWTPLWGMKVQFEFIEWCEERGIDTQFLGVSDQMIFEYAIERAVGAGDDEVVREVLNYCAGRGASSAMLFKQKLFLILKRFTGGSQNE